MNEYSQSNCLLYTVDIMPLFSTAARFLFSPSSQSSGASNERLVAETLARLNQANKDSSNDSLTEEERANLLPTEFNGFIK